MVFDEIYITNTSSVVFEEIDITNTSICDETPGMGSGHRHQQLRNQFRHIWRPQHPWCGLE